MDIIVPKGENRKMKINVYVQLGVGIIRDIKKRQTKLENKN